MIMSQVLRVSMEEYSKLLEVGMGIFVDVECGTIRKFNEQMALTLTQVDALEMISDDVQEGSQVDWILRKDPDGQRVYMIIIE
jgi:hypothetical protein